MSDPVRRLGPARNRSAIPNPTTRTAAAIARDAATSDIQWKPPSTVEEPTSNPAAAPANSPRLRALGTGPRHAESRKTTIPTETVAVAVCPDGKKPG